MPNLDFYAIPEDHRDLLTWLFAERTCHVYELASAFEKPLKQFSSPDEVLAEFDHVYTTGERWHTVHLKLYVLGAGPTFQPRLIELDPKACDGALFRFNAQGWGLVQLYLAAPTNKGLEASHTNHFTRKGAERWAPSQELDEWDFRRVQAFSSRLNREIKKHSVGALGSRAILNGAHSLWLNGVPLSPYLPNRDKPRWKDGPQLAWA